MVDRAPAAWANSPISGGLPIDINAAFPGVTNGRLVNLLKVRQMDAALTRWTESCLSERTVKMIIKGNVMETHAVEAGVPQGSPVSPILFAIYTSGLIKLVKQYVSESEGQSCGDALGCGATGSNATRFVSIPVICAAKSCEWANRWGLQFDTAKMEAAQFMCRRCHRKHLRPKLTANIRVGIKYLRCNAKGIGWLGFWMDTHLTCKEHHNQYI